MLISVFFSLTLRLIAVIITLLIVGEGLHRIKDSGFLFLAGFALTIVVLLWYGRKPDERITEHPFPFLPFFATIINAAAGIFSLAQAVTLL